MGNKYEFIMELFFSMIPTLRQIAAEWKKNERNYGYTYAQECFSWLNWAIMVKWWEKL
jgi:hypothetical protein